MRFLSSCLLCLFFIPSSVFAQNAAAKGQLQSPEKEAVAFANVALFNAADSSLQKAGITSESGIFELRDLKAGKYYLKATYLGMADLYKSDILLSENQTLDLGVVTILAGNFEMAEAVITATRPMVEVRSDRTVFNIQGTINSAGTDALSLMRKAPGVTVDNNDNISVLGRAGVLIYLDGKRLPLSAQDLSAYLQSLPADQIDRIDIITNPGSRYEAEGNAGIIDIRLKKDKSLGANGSLNTTASQGRFGRANLSGTGNYRNRTVNIFGSALADAGRSYHNMNSLNYQNGIVQEEINDSENDTRNYNVRLGTDFFLSKNHTVGFIASAANNYADRSSFNRITLARQSSPNVIDSILVAGSTVDNPRTQRTLNLNYRYDNTKGRILNLDLDYGSYVNETRRLQPNLYYDATESYVLTEINQKYDTPTDIDIYTAQLDFEDKLWGGNLGLGAKLSKVGSDNTFLVFDEKSGIFSQNDTLSNEFTYDEMVWAGYISYARPLGKKWNMNTGLRTEHTDISGNLRAFLPELQEPPVLQNYLNWFPNVGLTYALAPEHIFSINAGKRINRPDYNVLNPFNNRQSELSYEKGNPFLRPEIVNNAEIGYTFKNRYNFKAGISRTDNQITRLIAPDSIDPRAGYITWENIASRTVVSLNASTPVQITKKWNAYFNVNVSHINNQARYPNGAIIDVQVYSYNIYHQQTFDLPFDLKGEVSGYYSGPGVWGGVFLYESNWSLDLGLQRKFLNNRLSVRLSVSDIFYQTGWSGESTFNGLTSISSGRWDSRRASLNAGYRFGNDQVKSRKRQTGIEAEQKRTGSGN
jgi:hypothetical protein